MAWSITVVAQPDPATQNLLNGLVASLSKIQSTLATMQAREYTMSVDLTALTASVAAVEKAVTDGVAEIVKLVGEMNNTVDPAALADLQARLTTAATNLENEVNAANPPPPTP